MRFLLILVIIGGVVGGWWYYHKKHQLAATDGGDLVLAPNTGDGSGGSSTTGLSTAGGMPTLTAAELPADAKRALDQADALWSQSGPDPVTSDKATTLAALYSQVLPALYNQPGMHEREIRLVNERLAPLGTALFFTKTRILNDPTGTFAVYTAVAGENPDGIAKKFGMSRELLNRLRGRDINDSKLNPGDTLKVVNLKDKGGFSLHIDKGDYILDCYVAGIFAKRYACSVGAKESPTPVGHSHLTDRSWHPDWTHPVTHQVIHYDEPGHILGPMWLPLNADELGQAGIGIHGYTGENPKMGIMASNGCIRLQNQDAEELYQTLSHPARAPTAVEIAE
ncbi:MAG: L,D-transpeptidase family protein [Planctomycetes bacterium]|nr:L,D-transpeptidase family protein [Planctomycetota bacterium]